MFLNRNNHTLEDFQSAIANFVTMLNFIYDLDPSKQNIAPLIIEHCLEIMNLTNSQNFKLWFRKTYPTKPWIPHILLVLTHNFIRIHVITAGNLTHNSSLIQQNITTEPISILNQSIAAFNHIKLCIESAVTFGTGDYY